MGKGWRHLGLVAILVGMLLLMGLLSDRQRLREDLLRLHVVGASDSEQDQQIKLSVRDAVIASLEQGLADLTDPREAEAYVRQMLPKLEEVANHVLEEAGFSQRVTVTVGEEAFPARDYDTFSLPSGIYNALRIVIGEGKGQNWWCVVFPQLCYGETAEEFGETSNFSDTLDDTLTGKYEIRFWLLDQLGKLENYLFGASEGK